MSTETRLDGAEEPPDFGDDDADRAAEESVAPPAPAESEAPAATAAPPAAPAGEVSTALALPPKEAPKEPPIPEPDEEMLPFDSDADSWLELLRDGYFRHLREENEYREPPAFHRALHFAAQEGQACAEGKFPKQALNMQMQLLMRARMPEGGGVAAQKGWGKGGLSPGIAAKGGFGKAGGGPCQSAQAVAALAAAAASQPGVAALLPALLQQVQQGLSGPGPLPQGAGQLLLEAAKALTAGKAGMDIKGKGKGKGGKAQKGAKMGKDGKGVQRPIHK